MAVPLLSGPIKQQLGLLKCNLKNQVTKAEESIKSYIPSEKLGFEDCIERLQVRQNSVRTAADRIRQQIDAWTKVVQENPDEAEDFEKSLKENLTALCGSDDVLSSLEGRIARLQRSKQSASASAASVTSASRSPEQPSQSRAFKAPKMQLLTFSGDIMEFKQFWGIFEANIHNRDDLTNIEKFTYLLSQLKDDARKAVAGIYISDETYEKAVEQLKARFDRGNDRLVTMLYSRFMQIKSCQAILPEMQGTLDECQSIFRQLETAGETICSNRSLVCVLLSKFPPSLIRDLQRYYKVGATSGLDDVRKGLQKAIFDEEATSGVIRDLQSMNFGGKNEESAPVNQDQDDVQPVPFRCPAFREDVYPSSRFSSSGIQREDVQPISSFSESVDNNENSLTTALSAVTHTQVQQPPIGAGVRYHSKKLMYPPSACYFCRGPHFNGDCEAYSTASARIQRLVQLKRCTRCLKNHPTRANRCWSRIKCVHCHSVGAHASALCKHTFSTRKKSPVRVESGARGRQHAVESDKIPLFQTATTVAINRRTGAKVGVRLALDTMSSRCYIRDAVAEKLGLSYGAREQVNVSVFGSSENVSISSARVEFELALENDESVLMQANTTTTICKSEPVPKRWSEGESKVLHELLPSLADNPFDEDGTIDVLIGANMVWDFITGTRKATSVDNLHLIPTKFGLMLSGERQMCASDPNSTLLVMHVSNSLDTTVCVPGGEYPENLNQHTIGSPVSDNDNITSTSVVPVESVLSRLASSRQPVIQPRFGIESKAFKHGIQAYNGFKPQL